MPVYQALAGHSDGALAPGAVPEQREDASVWPVSSLVSASRRSSSISSSSSSSKLSRISAWIRSWAGCRPLTGLSLTGGSSSGFSHPVMRKSKCQRCDKLRDAKCPAWIQCPPRRAVRTVIPLGWGDGVQGLPGYPERLFGLSASARCLISRGPCCNRSGDDGPFDGKEISAQGDMARCGHSPAADGHRVERDD